MNECDPFWGEMEMLALSEEVFKLFVLTRQLGRDVKHEGRISHQYLEEKVKRLLKRIPIVLHDRLQKYCDELKEKLKGNRKTKGAEMGYDEDQRKRIIIIRNKVSDLIEGEEGRDAINALLQIVCFNWVRSKSGSRKKLQTIIDLIYQSELDAKTGVPNGEINGR